MRRGVKARFTSLRIRSCIGGSIMIIIDGPAWAAFPNSAVDSWARFKPFVDV